MRFQLEWSAGIFISIIAFLSTNFLRSEIVQGPRSHSEQQQKRFWWVGIEAVMSGDCYHLQMRNRFEACFIMGWVYVCIISLPLSILSSALKLLSVKRTWGFHIQHRTYSLPPPWRYFSCIDNRRLDIFSAGDRRENTFSISIKGHCRHGLCI